MQRGLVLLLLAAGAGGASAAESSGSSSGGGRGAKAEASPEAEAPLPPQQRSGAGEGMPFESVWQRYLPKDATEDFSGDAFPGQSGKWFPHVENTSDPKSWRDAFMKAYAASYTHFAHAEDSLPAGPESARDAKNITALKKWKARQEAAIKGFVPKEFQEAAKESADKRFKQRSAEIKAEQNATAESTVEQNDTSAAAPALFLAAAASGRPMKAEAEADDKTEHYVAQSLPHVATPASPAAWRQAMLAQYASSYMRLIDAEDRVTKQHRDAPARASDCRTVSELRAWRDANEARVKAFVPKEYQSMAQGDIRRKFERQEAVIHDKAAEQKQQEEQQKHQSGEAAASSGKEPKHSAAAEAKSDSAATKRDAGDAGEKAESADKELKHSAAAETKDGSAAPKQDAGEAGEEASEKPQSNATLLASDSIAALPTSHAPLFALAFLLALLTTGGLVAISRMQRTPDMGSSYLLVTEA